MIAQYIGWFCIINVILGEIAILASLKDKIADGARARVNFINIGYIAVAAWCFK